MTAHYGVSAAELNAGPRIGTARRRPRPAAGPAQVALGHLMSASSPFPSGHDRVAAVTRLRAAGCVFAEDEARLLISAAQTPAGLAAMVDRRAAGQPLEHVLGWAEFCGLRIAVDPGVFIPRRRTEFLVRRAAALARRAAGQDPDRQDPDRQDPTLPRAVVVVDLCCGSGAVGAALAASL